MRGSEWSQELFISGREGRTGSSEMEDPPMITDVCLPVGARQTS